MQDVNAKIERVFGLRVAHVFVLALVVLFVGCKRQAPVQKSIQTNFPSPEEAGQALFKAVQSHDQQAVMDMFGGQRELVSSGDESADKLDHERFAQKYEEMHRLVREPDGSEFLYVGAENWPFPVPLVLRAGAWRFDADAGKREILFRHIGEDETSAIDTCHAVVFAMKHQDNKTADDDPIIQYAETLIKAQTNAGTSPANGEAASPFHGYAFRILSGPQRSNFSVVAYPVEYRSSGVMTFAVAQDDVIYESDLGPDTAKTATAITSWKPDSSWYAAE